MTGSSIPERFEAQVRAHGDRLAIQSDDTATTFAELNRTANSLARRIIACRGEGPEPIALLFGHGADVVAAMLAVLKAGKFYVLLDANAPHERLHYIVSHSQAALIVSDERLVAIADALADRTIPLLPFSDPDDRSLDANLTSAPSPDDLATIIYTSGSTGQPKGVMHTHRSVLGDAGQVIDALGMRPEDRWVWHTSVSFAGSARTIFGALLGGSALFPFDLKRRGFAELAAWLLRHEITVLRSVPTTFRGFMATLPEGVVFPAVRLVSMGGEPLFRADVESFNRHFLPHAVLVHPFGPTESMLACWNVVRHGDSIPGNKVPIGYPREDVDVLLLDDDRRAVVDGEVGEIAVKSPWLSTGYWRDAEQTASVFVSASNGSSERLYLTGDLGLRASDGCLTHVGRRDDQVKVRGFRVEVSEIETALRDIDGIRDAVVVGRPAASGETRLIAYIVADTVPAVPVTQLRELLARGLPDYMIPTVFVAMDALPQTPSGKTDRRRLPAVDGSRPEIPSPFTPPRTELERALVRIWSDALGVTWLGVDDDFLEAGGESLIALRIVAQIKTTLGVDFSLADLFDARTVAAAAGAIGRPIP